MLLQEGKVRQALESGLVREGVIPEHAAIVADTLICADQRGIHTHGAGKIGDYLKRIREGVLQPNAQPVVKKESCSTAMLDAQNGFGQVAAYHGMNMAIAKAKACGIGLCTVTQSNHFGIASYYTMMASSQHLIGVSATNASAGIAPFGAQEILYGTNPFSVAAPSGSKFPVVLDMSSSVVARGKIRQAIQQKKDIPVGWARDKSGQPTTDPEAALKGSLEPIAGPKGSGLALMIEILCGMLGGSTLPGEVRVIKDVSGPCNTGHLLMALDPDFFAGQLHLETLIDQTIDQVKSLTPVEKTIYLPGELEAMRQERCTNGVLELPDRNVQELEKQLGIQAEQLQ